MSNTEKGKWAEERARDYLVELGYRFVTANYTWQKGEIDLVFFHNDSLVFVEVKFRNHTQFGFPEKSVNKKKREMVKKTARAYIAQYSWHGNIRFDIVALDNNSGKLQIEHFVDIN